MGKQIETLAQFVADTRWETIPNLVRQHTKLVLLDTLGVILAGAERPELIQLRARLAATAGSGATILSHGWPNADARTAAFLNAIAGRSIELCEGHRYVQLQGAVQILPGILAVGEGVQASGREMLASLILGYEVGVRLRSGMTARPLAHPNGQTAVLGAIAAGARMRGLDAAKTSLALRIGATLVLTASYNNAVAGATALNVAGGMSGFAGALAPELALAGFTAKDDAIEEALGNLVGDGFRVDGLLDELGTRWEISRNYFRLRACCNPIYAALDALEDALAELRPQADEIARIDVATYSFAAVMRNPDPPNYFASKYSLPHAAAAIALRGSAGFGALDDSALHDPAFAALRHRVHVTEDPAMTAAVPRIKPARVTVTLNDGRQSTRVCESPKGDFQKPHQESEIREKFRELAAVQLTPAGVAAVEKADDRAEQWSSARELIELLRRHGRTGA